ncbi:MAG: signal peptidase II [Succiniclasticum sp.]|jgi:signal peptidase II|nr:signal peptidase II [Succiniclasticum sp.]MCI6222861.1 signal peptidase II [Selenomonadales bacterium]MDY2870197.1 signal peptidase II [Succiniclasticum sp.]MDY6304320.1 signal peptidase II [Succiniclasticum sp.]
MILLWLAALVVVADRVTKYLVVTNMTEGQSLPVVEGIFHWTYVLNPGAAFGMMAHNRILFLAVGAAVVAAVWYFRRDILAEGPLVRSGAALFLGGALGNLWDRVQTGLVVDFFDFRVWPVFNVADIAICVGAALVVLGIFRKEKR